MNLSNLKGQLLASHPKRAEPALRKGVILVVRHDETGAVGLQINKQFHDESFTLYTVMKNQGLYTDLDQPLYYGGDDGPSRIHIIHSLDWYASSTVKINQNIGVSNDVSILAAISENEGPEYFRAIAGYTKWGRGKLDLEVLGQEPYSIVDSWSCAPASMESVFELDDIDQWYKVIDDSTKIQVSAWF
jgi:putative transcriptional regulator